MAARAMAAVARWAWVVAILEPRRAHGQYSVQMYRQPADAVAGLAFGSQPTASIYDSLGVLASTYSGFCSAEVYTSPTGVEAVYRNGSSAAAALRVPIVDGYCVFDGLYINVAGDYELLINGEDSAEEGFAYAISDGFGVVAGEPYEIVCVGYPSGASAGQVFGLQPTINVRDIGGNLVSDWSTGGVTASILEDGEFGRYSPNPGAELRPSSRLEASFEFGVATFTGLYINEAGGPYYLMFSAIDFGETTLPGGTRAFIPGVAIYIGEPETVEVLEDVSRHALGGAAFAAQPKLRVVDAGGNTVTTDETSLMVATLTTNPSLTSFSNSDAAYSMVQAGVATYSNLGIMATGESYVITFTLWEYSGGDHVDSGISVNGGLVDVASGPAESLGVITPPNDVIAGGAAFGTQPALALYDRGSNILEWAEGEDYTVEADVVPSLGNTWIGVVDTAGGDPPKANALRVTLPSRTTPTPGTGVGSLGGLDTLTSGDDIVVAVDFDGDCRFWLPSAGYATPALRLNVANGTRAAYATLTTLHAYFKTHLFSYTLREGEAASVLDAYSPAAFEVRGNPCLDGYGRAANVRAAKGCEGGQLQRLISRSFYTRFG